MRAGTWQWMVICALTSGLAARTAAQDAPRHTQLDTLARVRVVRAQLEPRVVEGQLLSADSSTLVVNTPRGPVATPVGSVRRLEVTTGRRVSFHRGARQGFVAGVGVAGALYLVGLVTGRSQEDAIVSRSRGVSLAPGVILGMTALGAIAGSLPGAGVEWRPTPLPVSIRPPRFPDPVVDPAPGAP